MNIAQAEQGGEAEGRIAQMQQQIDMLKLELANKAEELELKAAELALKAQQMDVTARLKAEDIISRMGPKVPPPPQRQAQKQVAISR